MRTPPMRQPRNIQPDRRVRAPHARDAALLTLGLSVSSAVGYVAVASSRTRKRIRMAELRYGGYSPQRLV